MIFNINICYILAACVENRTSFRRANPKIMAEIRKSATQRDMPAVEVASAYSTTNKLEHKNRRSAS